MVIGHSFADLYQSLQLSLIIALQSSYCTIPSQIHQ